MPALSFLCVCFEKLFNNNITIVAPAVWRQVFEFMGVKIPDVGKPRFRSQHAHKPVSGVPGLIRFGADTLLSLDCCCRSSICRPQQIIKKRPATTATAVGIYDAVSGTSKRRAR